ncbi:MAG: DNA replication/repair protein RecF [Firmicutes bacterium]|nr:DNA replication/repair protein RecF [Bacillota bacterium]
MYISSLSLKNFRNYKSLDISFSPFTNVIYGDNAQGKTNILEALYMFAQGRSHRAKSDRELIMFGEDAARLSLDFHDSERDYGAVMQLGRNGKKTIKINHVQISRLSKLMNYLNAVMFAPEDLTLIKGSPGARRHYTDAAISQLFPGYLSSLSDYQKALIQKNNALKNLSAYGGKTALDVWNEQLAESGAKIMNYRAEFIKSVNGYAKKIQAEISKEELDISYAPGIRIDEMTAGAYYDFLRLHADKEIAFYSSAYGIQRDDIIIKINGAPAKIYASQGQQRTAALALKIAQAEYIYEQKEEYPVLLLDDIMSELDINRRAYLSERIRDKQVFITSTDTDLVSSSNQTKLFKIKNGTAYEE